MSRPASPGVLLLTISACFTGCFSPGDARAQWRGDGVAVCTAAGAQRITGTVTDGAGGALVLWSDSRSGNTDLYVQRIASTGEPMWRADGVPVCTLPSSVAHCSMIADGAGGCIAAWQEREGAGNLVYAQRVNAAGVSQWGTNGTRLSSDAEVMGNPALCSDGAGGAIVAWWGSTDVASGKNIRAQRISVSGSTLWGQVGRLLGTTGSSVPSIAMDDSGGATILWTGTQTYAGYAQRLDADGVARWGADGVVFCAHLYGGRAIPDGTGGTVVAWMDHATNARDDIYAQRLDRAGQAAWNPGGVALCTAQSLKNPPELCADGSGGAIVAWADYRSGLGLDLFAQRVDGTGDPRWQSDGITLCGAPGEQTSVTVAPDDAGGAYFTWTDDRCGYDIYAQRTSAAGEAAWQADGVVVCNADGDQSGQVSGLCPDGAGGAIVAWSDSRGWAPPDIYVQQLARLGVNRVFDFTIATAPGPNGTFSPCDGIGVERGGTRRLTLQPAAGYHVEDVVVDGVSIGAVSDYIFANVMADHGVAATFAKDYGWRSGGIAVCTAAADKTPLTTVGDGAGGAVVVWQDSRAGNKDLYAQKVDSTGALLWTDGGVPVCTAAGDQGSAAAVPDGVGGAIIVWEDARTTVHATYAQHLDATGVPLWSADGQLISTSQQEQVTPVAVGDGTGGAIVAWVNESYPEKVYAQRLTGAGAPRWVATGVRVAPGNARQASPALIADGAGGAFIAWTDDRNYSSTSMDVYAQHLNGEGALRWAASGVRATDAVNLQQFVSLAPDGRGGAILAWEDSRTTRVDIYAQRIDSTGTIAWASGGSPICTNLYDQFRPKVLPDGAHGAVVVFWDGRGVFAQRVAASGSVRWAADGLQLSPSGAAWPSAVSDGCGGAVAAFEVPGLYGISNIYAQRVDTTGTRRWGTTGTALRTGDDQRQTAMLAGDGLGGGIAFWMDRRAGPRLPYDLYAQRIRPEGTVPLDPPSTCAITASAEAHGVISPGGLVLALQHESRSFTITPDQGYVVLDVLVDGTSIGPVTTYTFADLHAGHSIVASFATSAFTIQASSGSGGAVVPSGAIRVAGGGQREFTIVPTGNYRIADVLVDGVSVGPVSSYAFQSVDTEHTLTATFSIASYTITIAPGSNGDIVPSRSVSVPPGGSQLFTIIANPGYIVSDVLVDGSWVSSDSTYLMSNVWMDHTVSANFARLPDGWEADGVPLCLARRTQMVPQIEPDGSNGTILCWQDNRSEEGSRIYAQRMNERGVPQWAPNGVRVCSGGVVERSPLLLSDGSGGAFVIWEDNWRGIYAQHLDAAGARLWNPAGVPVCAGCRYEPRGLSPDGQGGFVVTWADARSGGVTPGDVYAQRMSASGTQLWSPAGAPVCIHPATQAYPSVVCDSLGYSIVLWSDLRTNQEVYAQRLDPDGVPQWASDGVQVSLDAHVHDTFRMIRDGGTGIIVVWSDRWDRLPDIMAQRIDAAGNRLWGEAGQVLCDAPDDQVYPALTPDGAGGAIVAWEDARDNDLSVYGCRVRSDGTMPWATNGVALSTGGRRIFPGVEPLQIASDGQGGAVVVWPDIPDGATFNLHARRIRSDGTPVGPANGSAICTAVGNQREAAVAPDGRAGAVAVWTDWRNGSDPDLYAQRISSDGTVGADYSITATFGAGGSISPAGVIGAIAGTSPVFHVTPDPGYYVHDVLVDGASVGAVTSYEFTSVDSTHTIAAQFEINQYALASSCGPHGMVTPAGVVQVPYRGQQVYEIVPDPGYHIEIVTVDSVPVGAVATYAVSAVDRDHVIDASFALGPGISGVAPSRGGDNGSVTVTVTGQSLDPAATVRLRRGGDQIVGVPVPGPEDPSRRVVTFDLTGATHGAWDLEVQNPDHAIASVSQSFLVVSGSEPWLSVEWNGPTKIRADRRKAFELNLTNGGDVDARAVPLWIWGLPPDAVLELDFALVPPAGTAGEPVWAGIPATLTGTLGRFLVAVVARIPPGTQTWRLYLTIPAGTDSSFDLTAALTPSWPGDPSFLDCLSEHPVAMDSVCLASRLGEMSSALAGLPEGAALNGIGVWSRVGWQCQGAATLEQAVAKAQGSLEYILGSLNGAPPSDCRCDFPPLWVAHLPVAVAESDDPNDKLGSPGAGLAHFVTIQAPLEYTIRFENRETASAPAQQVVITDPLDLSRIDLSTFSLGAIAFAETLVTPPAGSRSYATDIDLRPRRPLIVRIQAALDSVVGSVLWTLEALDPVTQLPPLDPLEGFLPPNRVPPEGEGRVQFTVMPRADLGTGVEVRNLAWIRFDEDTPIKTLQWFNTTDATSAESNVLSLAATQDSATFTVRWSGKDAASGVKDYSIWVAEDGGSYMKWLEQTSTTAGSFQGRPSHGYSFYSVARDGAGNLEPIPSGPDASTSIAGQLSSVAADPALGFTLEGALPNPATHGLKVAFTLPTHSSAAIELWDVAGRRILRRDVGALGPGRHLVDLDQQGQLHPGVYFLRLTQESRAARRKVVILR